MSDGATPGPWIVNGLTQANLWRIDGCGEGAKVGVEMLLNPVALVIRPEDAKFIAASPTMYAYIQKKAEDGDVEAQSIIACV